MRCPVVITIPTIKVDCLHTREKFIPFLLIKTTGHTSNSPNNMTAINVVSATALVGSFKDRFMATIALQYFLLALDATLGAWKTFDIPNIPTASMTSCNTGLVASSRYDRASQLMLSLE